MKTILVNSAVLISIILFLQINPVKSQNQDEQNSKYFLLKSKYNEHSKNGNIDSSIIYLEKVKTWIKTNETRYSNDYVFVVNKLGELYESLGNYSTALLLYQESLEITKEILGDQHPNFASCLNNLGGVYLSMGEYDNSLSLYQRAIEIRKSVLGDKNLYYSESLNNLGLLYYYLGDYETALPLYEESLKIFRSLFGDQHPDYATSINNLAVLFDTKGDYDAALPLYEESLEVTKLVLGEQHPDYAICLDNLGLFHYYMGDYRAALPLLQEALEIRRSVLGDQHPDYATSLNNVAVLYFSMGDYTNALPLYQSALEITKLVVGDQHPDYALSLDNLGYLYQSMGDYIAALTLYKEAQEVRRSVFGDKHPDYAISLNSLGLLYESTGNYADAILLYQEALEIRESTFDKQHPNYALSLNNLGFLYQSMGDYAAALPLYKEALMIYKSTLGELHPDYATSLNNLAVLYESMGNYADALPLYQEALKVRKYIYGEQNITYATSLNNLAYLYQYLGEYSIAMTLYEESIEITKTVLGEQHPDYATSLNNLASLYEFMGDYNVALPLYQEALKIFKASFGDQHPSYATSLNNLGVFYESIGDYEASLSLYEGSLEITKLVLGEQHPDHTIILKHMGSLYESMGNIDFAKDYYTQAINLELKRALKSADFLSEQQQKKYWNTFNQTLEIIQSFYIRNHSETVIPDILNIYIEANGSILNSKRQLLLAASTSKNFHIQDVYQDLINNEIILFNEENLSLSERHLNTDSLRIIVENLEEQLTRLGAEKLNITVKEAVGWEHIADALEPGEVSVLFSHFKYYTAAGSVSDSIMYIAYIIPYGENKPAFIPLFEENELEILLDRSEMDANAIYGIEEGGEVSAYVGDKLSELVWGKLSTYLEGREKVYFTATGLLNELNLAALPDRLDIQYRPMLVNRKMVQLLHPDKVVELKQESPVTIQGPIVAFGGLNYDLEYDDWLAQSADLDIATRGTNYFVSDSTRAGFRYLPYTLSEVEALAEMANESSIPIKIFTGNDGIEEQYHQLQGDKSPQILHLATHATFLEDVQLRKKLKQANRFKYNPRLDPMYRSRLMLSGANRTLKGEPIPEGAMDGILTANDVSTILLPNTDLVVLSACKTGVGEYDASEGVYGLQRAFSSVGVDNLMITLMDVNDASTARFMQSFYEKLFAGNDYFEAFRATQLEMINSQYAQPANWAGIVLLQ